MSAGDWVIEFRNGSYFQNPEADRGGPLATAKRFDSKAEAEKYAEGYSWIWLNGAMICERPVAEVELDLDAIVRKWSDSGEADVPALVAELRRQRAVLAKIDSIRNSIVGRQSVHWSNHIYPLVAALKEAGFGGEGYDVARPKAIAEVERWEAEARAPAEAENARLAEQLMQDGPIAAAARHWKKRAAERVLEHRSDQALFAAIVNTERFPAPPPTGYDE